MGTKATPPPRRDAPNASAALDRFFEVRLKPHVEGVARKLRRQFRTDLRAAVQVVVEAVAAAAAATVVIVVVVTTTGAFATTATAFG